jgi:hypothetical protein
VLDKEVFAKYIVFKEPDKCWPWKGTKNKGYGVYIALSDTGKRETYYAHRVCYSEAYSCKLTKDDIILHKCYNKLCCNPNHLAKSTQKSASKYRADREGFLLPTHVQKIRDLYATGEYSQKALGVQFGVSRANIGCIVRGNTWGANSVYKAHSKAVDRSVNGMAKLTDDDVRRIRKKHKKGRSVQYLAKKFKVSVSTIFRVVR